MLRVSDGSEAYLEVNMNVCQGRKYMY